MRQVPQSDVHRPAQPPVPSGQVQATMTAITYRRATVGDESALMVAQDAGDSAKR